MKVSIITATYNCQNTLTSAIESVVTQDYQNIEYIIIDGASTDHTVEIVKKYGSRVTQFVSEKDQGIYDALNKGILRATGDIVCFLHADDFFNDNQVISNVVKEFEKYQADAVYGDLVYVSQEDTSRPVRYWKSGEFTPLKLSFGWMPPHPALFIKREVYKTFGLFDLYFKIAADYDFILRILSSGSIKMTYLPQVLYKMRVGGISNRNYKTILLKSKEDLYALRKNNVGFLLSLFVKNVSKVIQFSALVKKNQSSH